MQCVFGIDIGGTQVKGRAYAPDGTVLASRLLHVGDSARAVERLRECMDLLSSEAGCQPNGLGIAAPGLAAKEETHIVWLPKSKVAVEGVYWKQELGFPGPVRVLNDAHAALLGERWLGAMKGFQDAILITLGTGLGGAILSEGRLIRGHLGRAGHVGHLTLDPKGPKGIVGMPGCVEDAIGNQTLSRRSNGRFSSTADLLEAVRAGDKEAEAVWLKSVEGLAFGLGGLINSLDPEAIIIGGGIAAAGDLLFEPLQRVLDEIEWRPTGSKVKLLPAALGEWSGSAGAAHRVFTEDFPQGAG